MKKSTSKYSAINSNDYSFQYIIYIISNQSINQSIRSIFIQLSNSVDSNSAL